MFGKIAKGLLSVQGRLLADAPGEKSPTNPTGSGSSGSAKAVGANTHDPALKIAYEPRGRFDWQALKAPPPQTYADVANPQVLQFMRFDPQFALEVGCNTGKLGALVKEAFPSATVWGVEPNDATAYIAGGRLDRVLNQPLEEVDWPAEGVEPGQIDTVFLFDVLEHIYDPWSTLLALRNLVSEEAQLVVSIPNVRNLFLIQDLIHGHWRYRDMGLLDITHIRFFTFSELMRMFYQTGFRVVGRTHTMCNPSQQVFDRHKGRSYPQTIALDSATITVHSEADLMELCALQFIFNLKPAAYDELAVEERTWIDAPYPETMAYAGSR